MNDDIKSILENLKSLNDDQAVTFTLPVSGHEVKLLPLNAKHITMIDSSFIAGRDGSFSIKFSKLMGDILKDTLILKTGVTYKDFGLYDFNVIMLQLRRLMGNDITVVGDGDESIEVALDTCLKKAMKVNKTTKRDEMTVGRKSDGMLVDLKIPSLYNTIRYDRIIDNVSNKDGVGVEDITKSAFMYTLVRFVKTITLFHDNEESVIEFTTLTPQEQQEVINTISSDMYRNIYEAIQELTTPIVAMLEVETGFSINIDQSFFITTI